MKKLITFGYSIIFLTILTQSCDNQKTDAKKLYNSKFKWTITVPEGFEKLSLQDQNEMQNKGAATIKKAYGEKVVRPKMIFIFKSSNKNYFQSNYQPYDSSNFHNFKDACIVTDNSIYNIFKAQDPGAKIDSLITIEKIDNLKFHKLKLRIEYSDKTIVNIVEYIRLFGNEAFTASIIYADPKEGKEMLNSWRKSKFGE